jgi:GNAT superfamily N-acetyltransferase
MKISLDSSLNLQLNPVYLEDQPILYKLMDEVYRASYQYIWDDGGDWYVDLIYKPETVFKELARETTHYFFVELKGEKVGILKYDYPLSPKELDLPNAMKIHRFYLHPKVHGKGIAQLLMNHCEKVAIENQLDTIWLEVMECQPQAKRFYEKCGFSNAFHYILDFDRIFPLYRGIEIWKKSI